MDGPGSCRHQCLPFLNDAPQTWIGALSFFEKEGPRDFRCFRMLFARFVGATSGAQQLGEII
jgi:hypothetical protein